MELVTVRWAQRIEQLLALASWRMEGYRQAAAWVAGRVVPSAAKEQGKSQERQAGARSRMDRKAAVARVPVVLSGKAEL